MSMQGVEKDSTMGSGSTKDVQKSREGLFLKPAVDLGIHFG